jgi:hypothetical protein
MKKATVTPDELAAYEAAMMDMIEEGEEAAMLPMELLEDGPLSLPVAPERYTVQEAVQLVQ